MSHLRNFTFLLFQIITLPSFACSRLPGAPEPTNRDLFREAKSVFIAHVYRTEEESFLLKPNNAPISVVVGEFRVVEVLKGSPPADRKIRDLVFGFGNCSLGLMAGLDYVFYVREGEELVLWPGGSRPLLNIEGKEAKEFLETLRDFAADNRLQ